MKLRDGALRYAALWLCVGCVALIADPAAAQPTLIATWGDTGTGPERLHNPGFLLATPDRRLYVVDDYSYFEFKVKVFDASGAYLFGFAPGGPEPGHVLTPGDLSLTAAGTLLLVDQHRVQEFDRDGGYVRTVLPGSTLRQGAGIVCGAGGEFYVTDWEAHRILRLSQDGALLATLGGYGSLGGECVKPIGLTVLSDGSLLFADSGNDRVQRLSPSGAFVSGWGSAGSLPGKFLEPMCVAADAQDRVYVADRYNHRVQVFTQDGEFLYEFGGYGSDPGRFNEPIDVALGPEGLIFVSDLRNQRIQVFAAPTAVEPESWGGVKRRFAAPLGESRR